MNSFRLWLEEQENAEANRKNFFDQVMRTLQATEDDLSKPLDELPAVRTPKPADGESQPPSKGRGALVKVQQLLSNILQQMSNDRGDVDSSVRAKRTMDMLNKRSNDGKVSPDLYLQDLLRELFGNDFHQDFLNSQPSADTKPTPPPDDNAAMQQGQDPAAGADLNDPTGGAGMEQPPGGIPDEMPMPNKPPFGGRKFI